MEITANAIQTVATNNNILFTETAVPGNCSIVHRQGSGLVTLRGLTQQCRARFRVTFGGNVAIPAGTTVTTPISIILALAINGEPVNTTTMISTQGMAEGYQNIFSSIFLDVPAGCCSQISVKNITPNQSVNVQNANLIVERVA